MQKVELDEAAVVSAGRSAEVIAVDEALSELESWDLVKAGLLNPILRRAEH